MTPTPLFYALLLAAVVAASLAMAIPAGREVLTAVAAALALPPMIALGFSCGVGGERFFDVEVSTEEATVSEGRVARFTYVVRSPVLTLAAPTDAVLECDAGVDIIEAAARLEGFGMAVVEAVVTGRLGRHEMGPLTLRLGVLGSLMESAVVLRVPTYLRVAPSSLAKVAAAAPSGSRAVGLTPSGMAGYGTQFYCVREYYPGDEFRRIDWKAYARTGRLAVKVFERESFQGVVVGVAIHNGFFRGRPSAFEILARDLAHLAAMLLRAGIWVKLAVSTEYGVIVGEKALNLSHLSRVLKVLSSVEWPRIPVPSGSANRVLGWLIREAVKGVPEPVTVIAVLDIMDESDLHMLKPLTQELRVLGHKAVVIGASPPLLLLREGAASLGDVGEAVQALSKLEYLGGAYGLRIHPATVALEAVVRRAARLATLA